MAEPATRRSALHDHGAMLARASSAAATLTESPLRVQLNLRLDPRDEAVRDAAEAVLGLALPQTPSRSASGDRLSALWLGPDEWLLVGEDGDLENFSEALRAALGDRHVALTDVSAARTVLSLSGSDARTVLMKGCRLDLHPRVFHAGHCVQTQLARAAVILHQTDDTPAYEIYVANSFALYLAQWLCDAMAEFGVSS